MTNRYHIPVVVTADDETSRDEVIEYVEAMLSNLEESDAVHRTYVENEGVGDAEAQRLLDMLARIEDGDVANATEAIDAIAEDEQNT